MAKEQIAGGGKVEDFSDTIDRNEAEQHIKVMTSAMENDPTGIVKTLFHRSMTSQYYKAVWLHFRGINLQNIPFEFVKDESLPAE